MDETKRGVYSLQDWLMTEKQTKSPDDYEISVWKLTIKWINRIKSEVSESDYERLLPVMTAMGLLMLHYPEKLTEYYETGRVNI